MKGHREVLLPEQEKHDRHHIDLKGAGESPELQRTRVNNWPVSLYALRSKGVQHAAEYSPAPLGISHPDGDGVKAQQYYHPNCPPSGQPAPEAFGSTVPVPQAEPAERVSWGGLAKSLCAHSLSWGPSRCWHRWRGTAFLLGPGLAFAQAVPCAWQWLGSELSARRLALIKLITLWCGMAWGCCQRKGTEVGACGKGNLIQKLDVRTHLMYLWGSHRPLQHLSITLRWMRAKGLSRRCL